MNEYERLASYLTPTTLAAIVADLMGVKGMMEAKHVFIEMGEALIGKDEFCKMAWAVNGLTPEGTSIND